MQPTITIYTTPTCVFCHQAMEYMKSKNIAFTEKDITTDQEAMRFVVEEAGQAVTPIITVNDEIIIGFDRPKLDQLIEKYSKS